MSLENAILELASVMKEQVALFKSMKGAQIPGDIQEKAETPKAKKAAAIEKAEVKVTEGSIAAKNDLPPPTSPKKKVTEKVEVAEENDSDVVDYETVKEKTLEVLRNKALGPTVVKEIWAKYGKDFKTAQDVPEAKRNAYMKDLTDKLEEAVMA